MFEFNKLSLPVRFGGLGISDPQETADIEYRNSIEMTEELTKQIVNQEQDGDVDLSLINKRKEIIRQRGEEVFKEKRNRIMKDPQMSEDQKKLFELSQEKGSRAWLTALPIQSLGYAFNKEDYRGCLALRYGWRIKNMPQYCACAKKMM